MEKSLRAGAATPAATLAVVLLRAFALLSATGLSLYGGYHFLRFTGQGGVSTLDLIRTILVIFSGFWLVWGALPAILGVLAPLRRAPAEPPSPPDGMTVILVPVYNEDPVTTFARVAAMNRSLLALDVAERFHIAILSDTTVLEIAAQEAVWFEHLVREPMSSGRIFYRRRDHNIGKKAGNIEDFISRSGGAYDYALVLDADSLMEGRTILEMARRMDRQPNLGLLQTVPRIIRAKTLFGRSMQFSSCYMSPSFARGAALMAGNEGPYWGHNAIVRVSAFAAHCGLPVLSGPPPHGGHILSHDYVEAALLSRAGWRVEVDAGLDGSYEEGPENLIEYAKRDRRWCQGNLQHRRLVNAPGLKWWSRFTFVQGIMAYMASPLWLVLLATSLAAAIFPGEPAMVPGFASLAGSVWALALAVGLVLVLPKMLILIRGSFDGQNRRFGGMFRVLASIVGEILFSTILAPVMLLLQSRAVAQVLLGLDGGWPATRRGQDWIGFADAFAATWWIVVTGIAALGAAILFAPGIVLWLAPATLPAILAPLLISASSHSWQLAKVPLVFLTEPELNPSPVIRENDAILANWQGVTISHDLAGARSARHVAA